MLNRLKHSLALTVALSAIGVAQPQSNSITAVRHWNLGDVTRVVVETTSEFEFRRDRVPNPDRLFFDLEHTKPKLGRRGQVTFPVSDPRLKKIRVAETQPGTARVVFDLEDGVEYTASRLSNPPRLIVELRANPAVVAVRTGTTPAAPSLPSVTTSANPISVTTPQPVPPSTEPAARLSSVAQPPAVTRPSIPVPPPSSRSASTEPVTRIADRADAPITPSASSRTETGTRLSARIPHPSAAIEPDAASASSTPIGTVAERVRTPQPELAASAPPLPRETPKVPATVPGQPRKTQQQLPPPPRAANLSGHSSMARVLGLKLGRIVIDAGHGGHDTGTIGPSGLLEKDLCLDIAQRVGDLIHKRLGAEVIYTRTDDTFIPLDRRPEIANEGKADLYLSIHANASPVSSSSGVETYYLNFTNSKSAMEVAARENASSARTMFELKDMIQRIALQDKVEESREFAEKVQEALYTASVRANSRTRDRGVRKAPFVVLIGASMPAILAEIGFISNPKDEALLKKPEFRQKIAEGLYQGLSKYASTLSHFEVAQK